MLTRLHATFAITGLAVAGLVALVLSLSGASGPKHYWDGINPNSLTAQATLVSNQNQGAGSANYSRCSWTRAPFFACYNTMIGAVDSDVFLYRQNGSVVLAS